jgi:SHS2 domain-containing protein
MDERCARKVLLLKLLRMARRFFDHTGDVGVDLAAPSRDGLFEEAALALAETVTEPDRVTQDRTADVALSAATLDDLLVDWLSELLYRFEAEGLVAGSSRVRTEAVGGEWRLSAAVRGGTFDARRHPLKVPVKGITYHGLNVHEAGGEWRTVVVFDI